LRRMHRRDDNFNYPCLDIQLKTNKNRTKKEIKTMETMTLKEKMEENSNLNMINTPALFNEMPHFSRSDKYNVISTARIVDELTAAGFNPTSAAQARSIDPAKRSFARHVVRMRHKDAPQINGNVPELVLMNAHNGTSSYKLMLGLFRIACANGLITGDIFGSLEIRHSGSASRDIDQIIILSKKMIQKADQLTETVRIWNNKRINIDQQTSFCELVKAEIMPDRDIFAQDLLRYRRRADQETSNFWTAFNVIQENIIKGGLLMRNTAGHWRRTRSIKSVERDTKTNIKLWNLADQFQANLK